MERWLKEFSKNIELPSSLIIVLGNKIDLKDEIKITFNKVRDYIDLYLVNKFSNIEA